MPAVRACKRGDFGYRGGRVPSPFSARMTTPGESQAIRVWDLPTRLFHGLLVAAVIGLLVSGKIGGPALVWHLRFGLLVFSLLSFRLLWGVVGGRWSRFASFLYAPGTVLRYLRGEHRPGDHFEVGHNPLGALSVFALIAVLALQVATGLVADDEIATTGPLNRYVSNALGLKATAWHTAYGQWLLLALVALHVAAIVVYRWRGQNLVRPMLSGDKPLPPDVAPSTDSAATRGVALVLVLAVGAVAVWIARQAA